jgi:alkylation response protein AidB-like acyl-CoA dehydrogenase
MIDASDVRRRALALISDHRDDDQVAFLDAQYEAGLAWIQFPEGEGGLGASPKLQEAADTELEGAGRRYPWMRNPMGIGMVGPAIAAHGTPEQRAHLRRIFTAEDLWCQLFSEPGAGSDVATLSTRAVRDGDEWVVDGQKVWTSLAHAASYGLLLARTDPDVPKHQGLTAFIVDMHAPGVEVRPLRQMSGESHFSEVYFTGVRLPDSARVGGDGDGWRVAVTTLMNERVSIGGTVAPRGSGPIAAAVATWRKRGDQNGARRHALLRLWVDAEVLRLGNMRAQQLRERGTPGPEGSVLKLGGALLSQRIAAFTVDLLGPAGLLHDYGMANDRQDPVHALLAAQSSTIAGGTSEIMRNILGERMLGLPGEPRADKGMPWSQIPKGL